MSITKEGLFKYQALNERQRKNLIILEAIKKNGPISKASIAKQTGYNIVTLSNHIEEYMKQNLVYERGVDASSGGRRPVLIELNKKGLFVIGIDFSKDVLAGVIADCTLDILSEARLPRPMIEQEDVRKNINALIGELIKKAKVDASKIKFIAIGTYGILGDKNGTIKGLDEEKGRSRTTIYFTELKHAIEKEFNIKVFFGQDASFAAFGEKAKNPSADIDSLLYIFQDIGKGVIIKGDIYCSTDIGAVDVEGLTGTLTDEEKSKIREESSYLRPWNPQMSLKNEAIKVIESGVGTKIVELLKGNLKTLNDDIVIKAASQNDDIAVELVESIGINLGVRIAYLINLFLPQVVIVGGGVEKAGGLLFDQIEKTIEKLSLEKSKYSIKVLPSVLGERAVSLGAASVALRESFLEA